MGEKIDATTLLGIKTFIFDKFPYTCGDTAQYQSVEAEYIRWVQYIQHMKAASPQRLRCLGVGGEKELTLYEWWDQQPNEFAHLKELALVVFSLAATSTSAERTFSSWSFIHSKLRSRLLDERVKKLVSVYMNMRQLDPIQSSCGKKRRAGRRNLCRLC